MPVVIVLLDQAAKAWAVRHLGHGMAVHVVEGVFALRLGFNPGFAFGVFAELGESSRWVMSFVSMAALVVLARIAYQIVPGGGQLGRTAVKLVFGGALGNLIDRARHGGVVDFIDLYWRSYHWPAFNLADSAITVGVLMMAATALRGPSTPASASRR